MIAYDPLFDVSGRVVVLTGACGLIARELAGAFHARGAHLILVDLETAALEDVASQLPGGARVIACNVTDSADVKRLVTESVLAHGQIDVLINCHQHTPTGFLESRAETFPDDLWAAVLDANLTGSFFTCREIGRAMIERGQGSIINFASVYGLVSSNPALYVGNSMGNPIAYSASKGGVVMMTRYLAAYWGRYGIRVNCITPHGVYRDHEQAFVDAFSSMAPLRRMMRVEEIVGATVFLASEASSYVTGSNLLVDGGWTAW